MGYMGSVPIVMLIACLVCFSSWTLIKFKHQKKAYDVPKVENEEQIEMDKWHAFKTINRRKLLNCHDINPYLEMAVTPNASFGDVQDVTVTLTGVVDPASSDWIAVLSPSYSNYTDCPTVKRFYVETGDLATLPLLCHYPLKFKYVQTDPAYLPCTKYKCQKRFLGFCYLSSCNASVTFRLINIRTDLIFVFFMGGVTTPCVLLQSEPIRFKNPNSPLYGHLSSVGFNSNAMRLTWVSGDSKPQYVSYAGFQKVASEVTTFTQSDMCNGSLSPAIDFGWHDPGFIHSAVMTNIFPSNSYFYQYGSDSVGWSPKAYFSTPPAAGFSKLSFIIYGDMGKAERDGSGEHYSEPGALGVIDAVSKEVSAGQIDLIMHIGDISYATGFLCEWDFFLEMIAPVASHISYMTAIGNHERDFPSSGSLYTGHDSGGECGVPYEKYFRMPNQGKDKPWYSFEQGFVHFLVMSTEHSWLPGSEQYKWMQNDLASVQRLRTPWVVFSGHRPMYASIEGGLLETFLPSLDSTFRPAVEPLLLGGKVDLAFWGHVHNYERTCAMYNNRCVQYPTRDINGADVYTFTSNSIAPIHAVVGMSGFTLDGFTSKPENWSLARISEFGYVKVQAYRNKLTFQFILARNGSIADQFIILK